MGFWGYSRAFKPHWTATVVETASDSAPDFSFNIFAASHWLLQDGNWNAAVAGGTEGDPRAERDSTGLKYS